MFQRPAGQAALWPLDGTSASRSAGMLKEPEKRQRDRGGNRTASIDIFRRRAGRSLEDLGEFPALERIRCIYQWPTSVLEERPELKVS